jgi:hypothetical protein
MSLRDLRLSTVVKLPGVDQTRINAKIILRAGRKMREQRQNVIELHDT